jgi:uncharacterized membrane protein YuzA (DUF378 family)
MSPMSWTNPLGSLADLVFLIIGLAQLAALVFSLTHAIRVRGDAFGAPLDLFGIIASIAAIVYIVDVRPAINDILRGPRW